MAPWLWALTACGGGTNTAANPANAAVSGKPGSGTAAAPATGASGNAAIAGTSAPPAAGHTAPATGGSGTPAATSGAGATGPAAAAGTAAASGGAGATTAGQAAPAGAAGSSGGAGAAGIPGEGPSDTGESSCLDGITDYENAGPFKFEATSEGAVKMWVPMLPAGCRVPIIHLANGTGATCANYIESLERMASHGFLTVCYENANTGAGTQGVMAFDAAMKKYPDMVAKKLGSTGHSQGGQAAFTVLALSEEKWGSTDYIYAGLAMEPASGFGTQPSGGTWQQIYAKIRSPMFMFSGTADMLVPEAWVKQGFDALDDSIEAYWWSAVGATHIPTPDPQEMQISIPWFRWKLLGDQKACEFFKKMPDGDDWDRRQEQNAKDCM